jgi:hypothetical protein
MLRAWGFLATGATAADHRDERRPRVRADAAQRRRERAGPALCARPTGWLRDRRHVTPPRRAGGALCRRHVGSAERRQVLRCPRTGLDVHHGRGGAARTGDRGAPSDAFSARPGLPRRRVGRLAGRRAGRIATARAVPRLCRGWTGGASAHGRSGPIRGHARLGATHRRHRARTPTGRTRLTALSRRQRLRTAAVEREPRVRLRTLAQRRGLRWRGRKRGR